MDVSPLNAEQLVLPVIHTGQHERAHVIIFSSVMDKVASLLEGKKPLGALAIASDPIDEGTAKNFSQFAQTAVARMKDGIQALEQVEMNTAGGRLRAVMEYLEQRESMQGNARVVNSVPLQSAEQKALNMARKVIVATVDGLEQSNPGIKKTAGLLLAAPVASAMEPTVHTHYSPSR